MSLDNQHFKMISTINKQILVYKNKLYKNTQADICQTIKNKLKTITRLKFWSYKLI